MDATAQSRIMQRLLPRPALTSEAQLSEGATSLVPSKRRTREQVTVACDGEHSFPALSLTVGGILLMVRFTPSLPKAQVQGRKKKPAQLRFRGRKVKLKALVRPAPPRMRSVRAEQHRLPFLGPEDIDPLQVAGRRSVWPTPPSPRGIDARSFWAARHDPAGAICKRLCRKPSRCYEALTRRNAGSFPMSVSAFLHHS